MITISSVLILMLLSGSPAQADDTPVRVQALHALLQQAHFSAPATVEALNRPSLMAEINAQIEVIPVLVGDRVNKDDVVVQLDCRYHDTRLQAARAAMQRIDAQLKFARTQLQRAVDLRKNQGVSEEVLDQRRTELLAARADRLNQQQQVRQAQIDVERCQIKAPFDAVVTRRLAQVGGVASPGTALMELVQLSGHEVSAQLRNAESDSLDQASAVHFDYDGKRYAVRVRKVLPVLDERTRTREVRLSFAQDAAPAGAAGRLLWLGPTDQLPADYVERRNGSLGVFIAEDGVARFHELPDAREGQPVQLSLTTDKMLITDGRQRLQDGMRISILANGR